jgi:indole-3-glycerol phosphate synthase
MPERGGESGNGQLPSILRAILADKATRLRDSKGRRSQSELRRLCRDLPPTRDFRKALNPHRADRDKSVAVIAEFKRRSPSRGLIRPRFDLAEIHRAYQRGGADAYSVLTEEDHFGGSLEDLKSLRKMAGLPLLRKDFLFDSYQIYESRAAGADALLLIVAALQDRQLEELIALSRELSMEALVEVHSAAELDRALECGAVIVGINNRDLHTFEVDIAVSLKLAPRLSGKITGVSESGISGLADIRRLQAAGIHAFLVGEHLIRAEDPGLALQRLRVAS